MKRAYKFIERQRPEFLRGDFLDVGCGAGKAIFLWAHKSRTRSRGKIYGIDLDPLLVRQAIKNHESGRFSAHELSVQLSDVFEFDLGSFSRSKYLIFWVYNPFGSKSTRKLAQEIARSTQEVIVLYANPVYRHHFLEAGFAEIFFLKSWHPSGRVAGLELNRLQRL